jgi:hypothetical protein
MNGIHEVTGSIPVWSTSLLFAREGCGVPSYTVGTPARVSHTLSWRAASSAVAP